MGDLGVYRGTHMELVWFSWVELVCFDERQRFEWVKLSCWGVAVTAHVPAPLKTRTPYSNRVQSKWLYLLVTFNK